MRSFFLAFLVFSCFIIIGPSTAEAQYFAKGRVYLDRNADGELDKFDFPQAAVRVHILRDVDGDGVVDAGDTLVATGVTNGNGEYEIMIPQGKLIQVRVSNNLDDAEEDTDDGDMDRNSTDLELVEDGAQDQIVGIRFRNVPIANSATINYSYLTFTVDDDNNGSTSLTFEGHDVDNSGIFNNSNFDISSRARTTNDVSWNSVPAWTARRQVFNSPDLTDVVDEIISRAGFSANNAITFIISGNGTRTAESHDGSNDDAPLLTLDYGSGASTYIARVYSPDLSTGASITSASTLALSFNTAGDTIDSLNFGYTGEPVACFAVADGNDILYQLNRFSNTDSIIGGVTVNNIEAMTFDRSRVDIIGADANRLGTINKVTGGFDQAANTFGTGGGAAGNIGFNDVDAIGMDAVLDTLFGVYQTRLFVINSSTGQHVPNYFGTNIDYVTVSGTAGNIDDIAIDPSTGILYATQATTIYTINSTTGAATSVGAMGVSDMEGITFSEAGQLYGTTGTGAGVGNSNSFYSINKSTGTASLQFAFKGEGDDFEACECLGGSTLAGILSLDVLNFEAKSLEDFVKVSWSALENEHGVYHIQRRTAEENKFRTIGTLNSSPASEIVNYSFDDLNPVHGVNYYRLKKLNSQSKEDFSTIEAVHFSIEESVKEKLIVFPNPSNGRFSFSRAISYSVFDMKGNLIQQSEGAELNLESEGKGVYFLESPQEGISKILIIK